MSLSSASDSFVKASPQGPRVLVIGAGFAGVSAAAALREGGLDDVMILEAQQHPGGRVQKQELENGYIEPGAQFIHGEKGNHLFDLAQKYGLLMDETLYREEAKTSDSSAEDYTDNLFFNSRGERVEQDRAMHLIRFINRTWREYSTLYFMDTLKKSDQRSATFSPEENPGNVTGSNEGNATDHAQFPDGCATVEDKFGWIKEVRTFAELVEKVHEKIVTQDESKELATAVLKWMEQWEYTDSGAKPSQLSLAGWGKYIDLPGYGLTVSCSGLMDIYRTFLARSLPPQALLLGKVVKTIFWVADGSAVVENGNNGEHSQSNLHPSENLNRKQQNLTIRVLCEDGEEFWADHVIVTTSIAYLQKHESSLFKPLLPENYRNALHLMGFGIVDKIFLVWDDLDAVLNPADEGIQFLWLDTAIPKPLSDKTARKTKSGGNWYDMLQGFERVPSHKDMLLTWIAGEEAAIMEELPEHEVRDVLHELLVHFMNNSNLPRPKQVVRTQWHSNPFILGAYSYIPADMDLESHKLLTVPIPSHKNPLLQISGEGTSQQYYSTVHGAIDSGQRAARAILRHYNRN